VDLCDAIRQALPDPKFEDFEAELDALPPISELAELWSGQRRGREYLNARRRFERYFAGAGKPKRGGKQVRRGYLEEDFLEELRDKMRRQRRRLASAGVTVSIIGELRVSKDRRHRKIANLELAGECVDRIIDALDDDDCEAAAEAFEECIGEANGFGTSPEWLDVDELVMR
jgi:hypothetical protein